MSRISGRHRIMGSHARGPRDDGFRSGMTYYRPYTSESTEE